MTKAYPQGVESDGGVRRMNRKERERYIEFWDAGDEHDESLQAEWDALDHPTRPRDSELLPDV